jgi:hypothetical protein
MLPTRANSYRVCHKQVRHKKKQGVDVLDSVMGLCLAAVCLVSLTEKAESNGCDDGVIHLPDRDVTIEICPSLTVKITQLSRRLTEMGKSYYFTFASKR